MKIWGATSLPTCVESKKTLFFRACVIWCVSALSSTNTDATHNRCWHINTIHVSDVSFKAFFSANKADWTWRHQCVHSTCHRAVEAGVSASWYWGAVAMPGATIPHKWTLFQWFPAHTHRERQADYTQLVTSRQTCTPSRAKTAAPWEEMCEEKIPTNT